MRPAGSAGSLGKPLRQQRSGQDLGTETAISAGEGTTIFAACALKASSLEAGSNGTRCTQDSGHAASAIEKPGCSSYWAGLGWAGLTKLPPPSCLRRRQPLSG
jgi:hypothetical protein